MVVKLVILDQY